MKLLPRLLIVLVVIGVALAAQGALMAHLSKAHSVTPGKLAHALREFPMEIGAWQGEDQEIEEGLKYGDDHLQRVYRNLETGQQLVVWMIYSSLGKDREHHPEVCMLARGLPEDVAARKIVESPGHTRPVQQYRYGHLGEQQLVYYWHYRLPSLHADQLDYLQLIYHGSRQLPASLTIEIFAPQRTSEEEQAATDFMLAVDAKLQEFIGEGAVRGNDRKPVTLTLTHEREQPPQP